MKPSILVTLTLLLSTLTHAQRLEQELQKIVDSIYHENSETEGIMVHVEAPDNDLSWSYAVGHSNRNTKEKLNAQQPVLIASNTKTYVSAAILKLVEQECLMLDAPIKKLISRRTKRRLKMTGYDVNKITVRHLLSHTSGITDYVDDDYFSFVNNNPQHQWTRDQQIDLAMKLAMPIETGKKFTYGDINYLLLTEIIEQKKGKPYHIAIRELLGFLEHNLNTTWFEGLEEKPTAALTFAHQYSSKFKHDSYKIDPSWDLYGGGGLASNARDLAMFFQLLFEGKIVKNKQVLSEIYNYVIPKEECKNYCLGLYNIPSFYGENAYYHGGFWGTDVMYIPKYNATISVFTLVREERNINPQLANELLIRLKKSSEDTIQTYLTENYELIKSSKDQALLILFPGGGSTAKETKEEFNIIEKATGQGISVMLMNFNGHLWVETEDLDSLYSIISTAFEKYDIKTDNIIIGGMSIGGNVALILSDYLYENKSNIAPQGVFIVDSPIDLYALYESAVVDVENSDFDEERLEEPKFIINYFEEEFSKDSLLVNIQKVSPFVHKSKCTSVSHLKNCSLRFYTEPDADWWKDNRQTEFENTNAYAIQKVAKDLKSKNWNQFELIETENKGYRSDGTRHPHSWSIVDVEEFVNWIIN